ncbi:MAG TPA: hypothetical protein VEC76_16305 [Streptosporangiaceae bacterium]|nr:hypothetical protein [Streptosporangiaceae bacterium]
MGSPTRKWFRFGSLRDLARRWPVRGGGARDGRPARHDRAQSPPWSGHAATRRFKYQALVTLLPQQDSGLEAGLPSPVCHAVVRARHGRTHLSKLFSALVTSDDSGLSSKSSKLVTMVVVGEDADDYLTPGEHFALLRGNDVARGTVTRRLYV